MKKALCVLMTLTIILSLAAVPVFASGEVGDTDETGREASDVLAESSTEEELAAAKAAQAEEGEARSLHLESIDNAWQLGGYVTEDGKKVRENVLLRTGRLTEATEEDLAALSEVYHVTTIIDFRSDFETSQDPEPEVAGAEYVNLHMEDMSKDIGVITLDEDADMAPAEPASLAELGSIEMNFSDEPGRAMIEMIRLGLRKPNPYMYITMLTSGGTIDGFRHFLDVLLEQDEDSVILYHCRSGKDRTGTATMILLTLLGVDEETVLNDFDLTNYFLRDVLDEAVAQSSQYTDDPEELEMVRVNEGVSKEFMAIAFDYAEEQSGSMLEFLKQQLNVTDEEIARLRELYLTD